MKIKDLTRAEEQIMQILWKRGESFVNEILEEIPEPKPAYNTVSTIVRILVRKGFLDYVSYGKSHRYFPIVVKEEYTKTYFRRFMKNYFSGSFPELVSFFTKEENMSLSELEKIRKVMEAEIHKQTNQKP